MERKTRALMAATMLLYLGPLLAGLSGMGWSATPVFVALMALWLVVMRPHQWPRQLAEWSGARLVTAGAQIGVSTLIVVILFGIGRGIGGVGGFLPNIPPLVPVALSFLSVPLSRAIMDPNLRSETDRFVDEALAELAAAQRSTADGAEDGILLTLLDLPDDADPVLTADALDAAMRSAGAPQRLAALEEALDIAPGAHLGLREAFVLWATDASRSPADKLHGIPASGFAVAGRNPHLLHLFARRALPLLTAQPGLWYSFPDPATVALSVDPSQPAALQASLSDLAAALDQLAPPEERIRAEA